MWIGEALRAAAADTHHRQTGIDGLLQHRLTHRRGHFPVWDRALDDETGKAAGFKLSRDQRHQILGHRGIVEIFLSEEAAILDDRDRRDSAL